jgi:hypothetical protein
MQFGGQLMIEPAAGNRGTRVSATMPIAALN